MDVVGSGFPLIHEVSQSTVHEMVKVIKVNY